METLGSENSISKDTDSDDNDLLLKLKKLSDRVALHETEKQKMREEFGVQRAKMKELFLQKEEELKKGSTEHDHLNDVIKKLETDLNEARTQLTVVTLELEGQVEEERRRYQDEVASLQRLITETVDESSRNEEEVKRLRRLNEKLEAELNEFRHSSGINDAGSGSGSGGTQLLTTPTAMISTIARKVVSQLGADSSVPPSSLLQSQASNITLSENLEESMRKAQEDAEVLRSLVIPLEEEIKALKDKLRDTDEKLRKYEQSCVSSCGFELNTDRGASAIYSADDLLKNFISSEGATMASAFIASNQQMAGDSSLISPHMQPALSSFPVAVTHEDNKNIGVVAGVTECSSVQASSAGVKTSEDEGNFYVDEINQQGSGIKKSCDMCASYKLQLESCQIKYRDLERQVTALERCKEELAKEGRIRKDMEQKWNEKKEVHKAEVIELQAKVKDTTNALKEIKELFINNKTHVTEELNRLTNERKQVQLQLDRLQLENENLIGKRNANARALQDEIINLPDNVEELQELLLKCREDLISARVGQEAAEQEMANLKEEAQLQRYQAQSENQKRQQLKNSLTNEIESFKSQLQKNEMARHQAQVVIQRLNSEEKELRMEMKDLNIQLVSMSNAKKQLEKQVSELKSRLTSLQAELYNSEIVQKDFVQLSQSLQQELERIRSSHTQVRWEHEDDVDQCPGCKQSFSVTRRKEHCRHCGRVFCIPCLTHTVPSGPKQRPSKVCDVCHTLLVEDTAPYFSTEPPQSNN